MTCSLSVQSRSAVPVWWTPVNCDFLCRNLRAKAGTEESYSYFLWYSGQYRGRNGLLYSHYFLILFNWLEIWERKNRKKKKGGEVGSGPEDLAWEWQLWSDLLWSRESLAFLPYFPGRMWWVATTIWWLLQTCLNKSFFMPASFSILVAYLPQVEWLISFLLPPRSVSEELYSFTSSRISTFLQAQLELEAKQWP